ncbi:MAG TPA: hypothetical protein VM687_13050 [Stenotrophomonas sp.]|nr:hypothetical protein [Stenotrophomonas sp.]
MDDVAWDGVVQLRPLDFDVSHLRRMVMEIEVRLDQRAVLVPVVVLFSNHCYTRSVCVGESIADALYCEAKRGGVAEHRVLDEARLAFSKRLPQMLGQIAHAMVFQGDGQVLFRVQEDRARGGDSGWYVCLELGVNVAASELRLTVKTCHYRSTRPTNVRGNKKRFFSFFNPMYLRLRSRHAWLVAQEKTKAPQ